MKNLSVASYFVDRVFRHLPESSNSYKNLTTKYKISPRFLENKDARLPVEQFWRLHRDVTRILGDEMLGYLDRPLPPGTFNIACHSLINQTTIRGAMERYCQFFQLVDAGLVPDLQSSGDNVWLGIRTSNSVRRFDSYAYESSLYYAHRLINWLGTRHVQPVQIKLSYAQPDHSALYRPLFFGAPVFFEREKTELLFNAPDLDRPVLQTPQTLGRFLRKPVYEMLIQYYKPTVWSGRVRLIIAEDLNRIPDLPEIAQQLSLHPQTLRRRLKSEGSSLQKLKNTARRDYAVYRLSQCSDSIETIAENTGYSEPSTFIRAFKEWTGVTPLTYRKTMSAIS